MRDDRSTNARIRDEALRLFAERGAADVSLREVAAAAGVSAPLIIHHFGSKAGLREALDSHVADIVSEMLAAFDEAGAHADVAGIAALLGDAFGSCPDLLGYLRRMLIDGGDAADVLFTALHTATVTSFERLEESGTVRSTGDEALRAAFLLANDLAAVLLRDPIRAATGVDPLHGPGLGRWTGVVMDVYANGVFEAPAATEPDETEETNR